MTHRASHTIFGLGVPLVVRIEWTMRKDLPLASLQLRLKAGNRHVADRAFVLNSSHGFWMIHRFTPHAPLPVRVARRIRHYAGTPIESNGNILAGRCHDTIVAGQASVRSLKAHFCVSVLPAAANESGRAIQES